MEIRDKVIDEILKLAITLIRESTYTYENYHKCFRLAIDFNNYYFDEKEIFVCEIENGIMIEDEPFYFEN